MQKTIVVLGSNSFSGASFIASALEAGYTVLGVSRRAESNAVFLPYKWLHDRSRYRFYQMDLNQQKIYENMNEQNEFSQKLGRSPTSNGSEIMKNFSLFKLPLK